MAKYIEKFILPTDIEEEKLVQEKMEQNGGKDCGYIDNVYPCGIFTNKMLSEVDFDKVTIFYGGNGSGKSSLLNIIANKLKLKRIASFNHSELFDSYIELCNVVMGEDEEGYVYRDVPHNSRIITSDDIFDYMLTARENNLNIATKNEDVKEEWQELRNGETIRFSSENYEEFSKQILARKKSLSRRKFIYNFAGKEIKLNSNGETALDFFENKLSNDCLFR